MGRARKRTGQRQSRVVEQHLQPLGGDRGFGVPKNTRVGQSETSWSDEAIELTNLQRHSSVGKRRLVAGSREPQ